MIENFLDKKYPDLHKSKPVERAVGRTSENIYVKDEKIEAYLDRLGGLILKGTFLNRKGEKVNQNRDFLNGSPRPKALFILREMIMNKYVRVSADKKTEGAVRTEERAARELGMNLEYGEEQRTERQEILIKDLEKSLDNWISYLSDNNEPYPAWFRYYVFRNVLNLGEFDKDKGEFKERSAGSAGLFPDIDRGALAYIQDVIESTKDEGILHKLQEAQKVAADNNLKEGELLTKEKAEAFSKLSFAKQYRDAIKLNGEITPEMREETRGKWVKYQQDTDPTALWASLQNKGTAWCTKGFATASAQLKGGDFYVYYTLDKSGQPNIPRIAIRMNGQSQIGEVRGVADGKQNLEGNMTPILEEKFKEFGSEANSYKKKSKDMKKITELAKKQEKNENLNKEELVFLYEIDSKIEGFGYGDDPRIRELRKQRNLKEDAPIVLNCLPEQIAYSEKEIIENTKAYIGPLFKGIFQKNFEHIYTEFPDKKIRTIELDSKIEYPKNSKEWVKAFKEKNIYMESGTEEMFGKMESINIKEKQDFVILTVEDLGFRTMTEYQKICDRAKEFGLELCAQDDGLKLRLAYEQPVGSYFRTAMESIKISDGDLRLWNVNRYSDGECSLYWSNGKPDHYWDTDGMFAFRLRK